MERMAEQVRQGKILVSDGGWGSFLISRGLRERECPELWCLEHPDIVREIAEKYLEAGADIVMTNSFGGTRLKLDQYGLGARAAEINEAAAKLSREAAGPDKHVMASIGPCGKFLMMGDITPEELYDAFREQAMALEKGGADACSVETMGDIQEAVIAVQAIRDNTNLEIVASFTFAIPSPEGWRTHMGVTTGQMAVAMLEAGAHILGANCSVGPAEMVEIIGELRAVAPDTPLLVHPNAGQPELDANGCITYPLGPDAFSEFVPRLVQAGAGIIGGCCGTGPAHIRRIREAVDALRQS